MKKLVLLSLLMLCGHSVLFAQKNKKKEEIKDPDSIGVVEDRLMPTTLPLLLFDDSDRKEKQKIAKKKTKKNIYFGERTKKARIRTIFREQLQMQVFNFVTGAKTTDPYIRDIYWFDTKNNMIRIREFDPSKGYLLHGPYEKTVGEALVEKGNFYFGTRHGTWMFFDSKNVLLNKLHFSEGWPKDSRVTYYDGGNKKIEKLSPIEYDLLEGNFFHFFEDGQIGVSGEYQYGEKVGIWTEYWDIKNKLVRKREIQYQEKPFTKNFRPYIRAEWDKDGNLIYRKD